MGQQFTLIFEGASNREFIPPDALVSIVSNFVHLVERVDANSWNVRSPRLRWGIVKAETRSPMHITFDSEFMGHGHSSEPLAFQTAVAGLQQLEAGSREMPLGYDDQALIYAQNMFTKWQGLKRFTVQGTGIKPYSPNRVIAKNAKRVRHPEPPKNVQRYGSIVGSLVQITIDKREGFRRFGMQIVERTTDRVVDCELSLDLAEELRKFTGERAVLYGTISRSGLNDAPISIHVERYRIIKKHLPRLADIHKLGISITGGEDAADYVERLRG